MQSFRETRFGAIRVNNGVLVVPLAEEAHVSGTECIQTLYYGDTKRKTA